jgi:serine/threonine-protein kinase
VKAGKKKVRSARAMTWQLGRYEVYDKIASGGMADVFIARLPIGTSAFCALKVLRSDKTDQEYRDMFAVEQRLMKALSHPATVQVYEIGECDERAFIAMELLAGQSLKSLWELERGQGKKLPYDLVAWLGARVAEGLDHAHGVRDESGDLENVVHRDVNPSNILVTFDGRVKVIDFGLAKSRSGSQSVQTAVGTVKGKAAYLSPESLEGKTVDRRADVFALATTLWEISADQRLFKQPNDVQTVLRIMECKVPDPREILADYPDALWTVLRRGLARDRDARYATAGELSRDLYSVAASLGRSVGPAMLADVMRDVCVR